MIRPARFLLFVLVGLAAGGVVLLGALAALVLALVTAALTGSPTAAATIPGHLRGRAVDGHSVRVAAACSGSVASPGIADAIAPTRRRISSSAGKSRSISTPSWNAPTEYSPRISERSDGAPSHYRLAVTESGINESEAQLGINEAESDQAADAQEVSMTPTQADLLWIGKPLGTHAGLLVLLGSDKEPITRPAARTWPLPLSKFLGVRIYEGG